MKSASRFFILAFMVSMLAFTAGAGSGQMAADNSNVYTIEIKDFTFSPRTLVIPVGAKVTWTNKDEEPHKVAETSNTFTSLPLDTDEAFTYEFKSAGRFKYFCTLHPHMTGEIVVQSSTN